MQNNTLISSGAQAATRHGTGLPSSLGARALNDRQLEQATRDAPTGYEKAPRLRDIGATHTIRVSRFTSLSIPHGTQEELSWEETVEWLTTFQQRPNKEGPLFSTAIYRDGIVLRRNENVVALSAFVADCDETHTFLELDVHISALGVRAIVIPTHSYGTPDTENHPDAPAPAKDSAF